MLKPEDYETWAKNVLNEMGNLPHYLENATLYSIQNNIHNVLKKEQIMNADIDNLPEKLKDYRYVSEICELFRGRHIRWIRIFDKGKRIFNSKITNGGIVTDIKFMDNGIHIQCKNARNQFLQFKFDDCLLFQKLTAEECILLMANAKV
jgi:hypothetical protein